MNCDVRKSKLKCDSEGLFHMSRVAPLFGLISSPRFSVYGSALQVVRGFSYTYGWGKERFYMTGVLQNSLSRNLGMQTKLNNNITCGLEKI